jgi:hypothetical protein
MKEADANYEFINYDANYIYKVCDSIIKFVINKI